MRRLLETVHVRIDVDDANRVVRFARTNAPMATLAEAAEVYASALAALATFDRTGWALLSDLREAPGRNDPEFEAQGHRFRVELMSGFARTAVLVRTAAGKLQIGRIVKGSNLGASIFDDEATALAFLTKSNRS